MSEIPAAGGARVPAHDDNVQHDHTAEHLAELNAWRARYASNLAAPYGWWSITALDWLEQGNNLLGSAPEATLHLPLSLPERSAALTLEGDAVSVTPLDAVVSADGAPLQGPTPVANNTQLYVTKPGDEPATGIRPALAEELPIRVDVIQRADRHGVRVRDPLAAAARDPGSEIAWFRPDPAWRLPAVLLPPERDEEVAITNRIGQTAMEKVVGRVAFEVAGARYELLATQGGKGKLFINFKDATNGTRNGTHTYPGGRFINIDPPVDGRMTIDFNYAHHPPCAHTPYATCPMPTPGNTLPFAVLAGERSA